MSDEDQSHLSSSYILLDWTTCSASDSSVVCIDTSFDQKSKSPAKCLIEQRSPTSCIIIPDSEESEDDIIQIVSTSIHEQKKEGSTSVVTTASNQDACKSDCDAELKELSLEGEVTLPCTPSERISKRRRIGSYQPDDCPCPCDEQLTSTPLAGSAIAPKKPSEPIVTPITVRYERIRAELSATKKETKKLITGQEELQEEMQRFREEMTNKRKREEEEEKKAASVPVNVKTDQCDSMLRPVVIDGSNVAMSHGNQKIFSCKGIALCIQFFQQRGHTNISALVPLHRKTADAARSCPIKDAHILDELESKGLLSYTPSRTLNGRRLTPYDDRMMLQLACRNGGVIVSNDNYRDLMGESAQFKCVIENRLIMFTFVGDNFMVPEDPHGRYGPLLSEVLRRAEKAPLRSMVNSALYNRRAPLEQLKHQWQHRFY
ncbi:probable ribonuclease ZC3H12C [Strongylocentrotus purpuratus]|uniref:RNase NYN domain-containing protein n=1 Tax=Strongylocentrotus purpuratus TaxID=7668 RepID=A0A7M7N4U4_STRPU|nr:probable ribonuclease ZC3H12C [Strongylocentrotus purpuratus]XP_030831275.1 probable ribonuclease ZC3H12C [Strongylocentrotus purpuratus]